MACLRALHIVAAVTKQAARDCTQHRLVGGGDFIGELYTIRQTLNTRTSQLAQATRGNARLRFLGARTLPRLLLPRPACCLCKVCVKSQCPTRPQVGPQHSAQWYVPNSASTCRRWSNRVTQCTRCKALCSASATARRTTSSLCCRNSLTSASNASRVWTRT